jgi:hypothetical protein
MQSLILIALLQASMGEPAQPAPAAEPATVEAPATPTAPRTERRRVCQDHGGSTGQRLSVRRCRWEEVVVEEEAPEEVIAEEPAVQGGAPSNEAQSPTPEAP